MFTFMQDENGNSFIMQVDKKQAVYRHCGNVIFVGIIMISHLCEMENKSLREKNNYLSVPREQTSRRTHTRTNTLNHSRPHTPTHFGRGFQLQSYNMDFRAAVALIHL